MTDKKVMQQALEALHYGKANKAVTILREALEQPVQEPVAWMSSDRAWMWSDYSKAIAAVANIPTLTLIPLYTAPPATQREWVGLTDEEIEQGNKESWVTDQAWQSAVWWAEAKLKEKNHD
jgi:hypothetical protein